jgi:hypothetical protein
MLLLRILCLRIVGHSILFGHGAKNKCIHTGELVDIFTNVLLTDTVAVDLHVINNAKAHSKYHVDHTKYDGQLHFV